MFIKQLNSLNKPLKCRNTIIIVPKFNVYLAVARLIIYRKEKETPKSVFSTILIFALLPLRQKYDLTFLYNTFLLEINSITQIKFILRSPIKSCQFSERTEFFLQRMVMLVKRSYDSDVVYIQEQEDKRIFSWNLEISYS